MALATADGRYGDVMEQALYNGALSGISLDGERFFYDNPLASRGGHHRWIWHKCPCCPANIARLIASLGGCVYSTGPGALGVHLYARSEARASVDGVAVSLRQETDYPWDGAVAITLEPERPHEFRLALRVPGWCRSASLSVNGEEVDLGPVLAQGYATLDRRWQAGDSVLLRLAMPVERIRAHPAVLADQGRVALKRGPIVYCLEAADNAVPLHAVQLPADARIDCRFEPDLLGGVGTLSMTAEALEPEASALYSADPLPSKPVPIKAVPYHAWDHREPGEMLVWVPEAAG
jgi:DUF1680 family protein